MRKRPARCRDTVSTTFTLVAVAALITVTVVGLLGRSGRPDRAYSLEQRLRCPVCKSVSIAESPSDTATGMRQIVQTQVRAGRSDQQILDYFRARYGDWILLDPPAAGATLPLWLLVAAALAAAAAVLWLLARRWARRADPVTPLSEDQRAQVAAAAEQLARRDTGRDPAW